MLLRCFVFLILLINLLIEMSASTVSNTVLYTHKMCPFAQKAWVALNLAQVPYELDEIALYGGKPNWFLKMNPKGQVPVLKFEDKIVTESEEILDFIASSSFPSQVNFHVEDGDLILWYRQHLDKNLKPVGKEAVCRGVFSSQLQQLLLEMEERYAVVKSSGGKGDCFLAGECVSMADASAFPFIFRLRSEYESQFSSLYPELCNWLKYVTAREEFAKTIVSSWWWWW